MEMTYERAAEILDPDHRENYDSLETVKEACRMGMDALKKQIPAKVDLWENSQFGNCPHIATKLYIDRPCSSAYIASSAAKH